MECAYYRDFGPTAKVCRKFFLPFHFSALPTAHVRFIHRLAAVARALFRDVAEQVH